MLQWIGEVLLLDEIVVVVIVDLVDVEAVGVSLQRELCVLIWIVRLCGHVIAKLG